MSTVSTANPALLVRQPIGYVSPPIGRRLALGLADPLDGQPEPLDAPELLAIGPLGDQPRLVGTLGTPTTRTRAEGIVTGGRGQAPTAASSAALLGLCCTT